MVQANVDNGTCAVSAAVNCPNESLGESGLTLGWLVDVLLKNNAEFKNLLGVGKVQKVGLTNSITLVAMSHFLNYN